MSDTLSPKQKKALKEVETLRKSAESLRLRAYEKEQKASKLYKAHFTYWDF